MALSGYEALCAAVQNNVTESKLVSELDYAMKKQGAEETLTTLNCGFLNDANGMGLLHSAANSQKAVKYGDCIAAAITPRYNGYWVQMLRTLCVGKENQTVVAMHEVVEVLPMAELAIARKHFPLHGLIVFIVHIQSLNGWIVRWIFMKSARNAVGKNVDWLRNVLSWH